MAFAAVKKDEAGKTPPETKRSDKHSKYIKGIRLKICRLCEELRGDSPSGQAPAKEP